MPRFHSTLHRDRQGLRFRCWAAMQCRHPLLMYATRALHHPLLIVTAVHAAVCTARCFTRVLLSRSADRAVHSIVFGGRGTLTVQHSSALAATAVTGKELLAAVALLLLMLLQCTPPAPLLLLLPTTRCWQHWSMEVAAEAHPVAAFPSFWAPATDVLLPHPRLIQDDCAMFLLLLTVAADRFGMWRCPNDSCAPTQRHMRRDSHPHNPQVADTAVS
jgi:hypothetical protein